MTYFDPLPWAIPAFVIAIAAEMAWLARHGRKQGYEFASPRARQRDRRGNHRRRGLGHAAVCGASITAVNRLGVVGVALVLRGR